MASRKKRGLLRSIGGAIGALISTQSRTSKASNRRRWFAFWRPTGRGKAWKYPKSYLGPFHARDVAIEAIEVERARLGEPRSRFTLKQLTDAQFKKIWGLPPPRS